MRTETLAGYCLVLPVTLYRSTGKPFGAYLHLRAGPFLTPQEANAWHRAFRQSFALLTEGSEQLAEAWTVEGARGHSHIEIGLAPPGQSPLAPAVHYTVKKASLQHLSKGSACDIDARESPARTVAQLGATIRAYLRHALDY